MPASLSVKFLGTSSQPNVSRNYSSLLVRLDRRAPIMVDCGEGTQRQIMNKHIGAGDKLSDIQCILITHLHADHVLGLAPLLTSLMGPSSGSADSQSEKARVEIYGPLGLRALLRTQLTLCYTTLSGKYVVHELLWPGQRATTSQEDAKDLVAPQLESDVELAGSIHGPIRVIPEMPLHASELPGRDIVLDEVSKSWPNFTTIDGIRISAAPILHRCPTLGYVLEEADSASPLPADTMQRLDANAEGLREKGVANPRALISKLVKQRESVKLPDGTTLHPPPLDIKGRKMCICGDTRDASGGLSDDKGLVALAQNADLLIHEATNAAIHQEISGAKKPDVLDEIEAKATARGHSLPQGAGNFAGRIKALNLVLNHFSVRYPAPPAWLIHEAETGRSHTRAKAQAAGGSSTTPFHRQLATMQSFAMQATIAWHAMMPQDAPGDAPWRQRQAQTAWDGYVCEVERPLSPRQEHELRTRKAAKDVGNKRSERAPRTGGQSFPEGSAAMLSTNSGPGPTVIAPTQGGTGFNYNLKDPYWGVNASNKPKRIKGIKGLHQMHLLDAHAQMQQQHLQMEAEKNASAPSTRSAASTAASLAESSLDRWGDSAGDTDGSKSSTGSFRRVRKRRPSLQGTHRNVSEGHGTDNEGSIRDDQSASTGDAEHILPQSRPCQGAGKPSRPFSGGSSSSSGISSSTNSSLPNRSHKTSKGSGSDKISQRPRDKGRAPGAGTDGYTEDGDASSGSNKADKDE